MQTSCEFLGTEQEPNTNRTIFLQLEHKQFMFEKKEKFCEQILEKNTEITRNRKINYK